MPPHSSGPSWGGLGMTEMDNNGHQRQSVTGGASDASFDWLYKLVGTLAAAALTGAALFAALG